MEVNINIRKNLICDFLRYLFPVSKSGALQVKHSTPAGKFICSMVCYSDKPVNREGNITLKLPMCDALASADTMFIYFDEEAEVRINNILEVLFDMDFDRYWLNGVKMNISKKDITLGYIHSRNLVTLDSDVEMLNKRIHRKQVKQIADLQKLLTNKAYYIDRQIRESIERTKKIL